MVLARFQYGEYGAEVRIDLFAVLDFRYCRGDYGDDVKPAMMQDEVASRLEPISRDADQRFTQPRRHDAASSTHN